MEGASCGVPPLYDSAVVCILIELQHGVFHHFTASWLVHAPELLGHLKFFVGDVPRDCPLGEYYGITGPTIYAVPAPAEVDLFVLACDGFSVAQEEYRDSSHVLDHTVRVIRLTRVRLLAAPDADARRAILEGIDMDIPTLLRELFRATDEAMRAFDVVYQRRARAFDRLARLFTIGDFDTAGTYGRMEYRQLRGLWESTAVDRRLLANFMS
jgi:hypothetical protein